jgi:hypothetical protein
MTPEFRSWAFESKDLSTDLGLHFSPGRYEKSFSLFIGDMLSTAA